MQRHMDGIFRHVRRQDDHLLIRLRQDLKIWVNSQVPNGHQ